MKKSRLKRGLWATLPSLVFLPFAAAQEVKATFEKNSEIYVQRPDGEIAQLTHDGLPKGLPLWSKDGTEIAYLQSTRKGIALGKVVVIKGDDGSKIEEALVRPVVPGEGDDMRFIESLEWLNADTIVAAGSINPSTVETGGNDLKTGKETIDYYDDDGGAVFSPEGKHVAYITGAPHFTPESTRRPELDVDLARVFPAAGAKVDFLSKPVWDGEGRIVAIVARDEGTGTTSLVRCAVSGGCSETKLSRDSTGDSLPLSWSDGDFKTSPPPNRSAAEENVRARIRALGGSGADIWYLGDAGGNLPRKTSVE